jgi:hypothetical protein
MSKAIKLNVAEPCHENWANMQANEQGRFCLACSKTVVDFTGMSDKQLYDYFKNYTGSTCGRLNHDQLNRDLVADQQKKRGWFAYAVSALLPALLITTRAEAQGEVKKEKVVCTPDVKPMDTVVVTASIQGNMVRKVVGRVAAPKAPDKTVVKGIVKDEEGNPIPFASIMVKGTHRGAAANEKGEFEVINKEEERPLTLVVSAVGFGLKEIQVAPDKKIQEVIMHAELTQMTMGAIVTVKRKKLKKPVFHNFTKFVADSLRKKPFTIYPNPAVQGATIKTEGGTVKGNYFIRVLDANGILVQEERVNAASPKLKSYFTLARNIIPGHYTVLLTDDKRKQIGSQQLIVH